MDKQTIAAYNRHAEAYDAETVNFWKRFSRTFLDNFIQRVDGEILDIGSGPGRGGLFLQEAGLDVFCLDASEEMVRLSTERGLPSLLGDFNTLPFFENHFNGVWAYTSLLHTPKSKIVQPLAEIYRVLKPKGVFALGMIEGEGEYYRESSKIKEPRWFSFYTKEELEELLENSGFERLYFETFKPGSKNYLQFIARKK